MFGLIGKKLKHSYSKVIHEKLQNKKYNLIELNSLDSFFQEKKFKGINITIPFKSDSIAYCDILSETAIKTGAVNSIVNNGGILYGYNTDYDGLSFMLEHHNITLENEQVLILGNGSTSRTIQVLCADRKAEKIVVSARHPKENEIKLSELKNQQNISIIFNATPVGMYPQNSNSLEIDLDLFPNLKVVIDLIYNPFETQLLLAARNRNIKTTNGMLMLVHQAIKSSEFFHNTVYDENTTLELYKSLLLETTNFVLIGLPMSGKSYFSRLIASKYNKKVVDVDKLIEKDNNQSISNIFQTQGEQAFRYLETKTIMEISKSHNQAISTGGGAILDKKNIEYLKQNGIIIFLDVSLSLLKTFNPKNRPLLKDKQNIEKLYNERYSLYKKYADITITKDSVDEFKILSKIEVEIDEYFNS